MAFLLVSAPTSLTTPASIEDIQDATGVAFTDTAEIDFNYNDGANQVTADLKVTTVTPGSYTNTNLTVDSKGRITAAASGSGADLTAIPVGSLAATSLRFAGDAAGSGWSSLAANTWTWGSSGNKVCTFQNYGLSMFDPSAVARYIDFYVSSNTLVLAMEGTVNTFQLQDASNGYMVSEMSHTAANGNTWGWWSAGGTAGGANNAGAMYLRNQISPANFVFGASPTETVFVGKEVITDGLYTTFTILRPTDSSNIGGTTTANAATTISHGSGTALASSFKRNLGLGDKISLSSAAGTYATVTAIASDSSLTVDTALGDGSSQTINRKRAIQRWDSSTAVPVALLNDLGNLLLGDVSTSGGPQTKFDIQDGAIQLRQDADPGAPTNAIRIGAKDSVAGTARTLHLRTEEAVGGAPAAADARLSIWINNVEYYIHLTAV